MYPFDSNISRLIRQHFVHCSLQLAKAGYKHIDAVEPSASLLNKAKELNVYQRCIQDFVGANKLDVSNGELMLHGF